LSSKCECLRLHDVLKTSELVGTNVHEYVTSIVISCIGLPLCRLGVESDDDDFAMLLQDVFTRLPRVLSLDLSIVDFEDCLPSGHADQDAELRPFAQLFPFPKLRELCLSSVAFDSRDDFIRLLAVFPRLIRITVGDVVWMGRQTNGASLGLAEREIAHRVLINLKALRISPSSSQRWSQMRMQCYSRTQQSCVKRIFDWATYAADYRHLVLQLLHDCAPTVEQLCITTADSLAEVDSCLYTSVQDVKLIFRDYKSRPRLPFSAAAPTFLSRLASRDLAVLTLCLEITSVNWAKINWSLVDWPAVDDVLVHLHRRNADFKVIFRMACIPTTGNGPPTLSGRCRSSAVVAKRLTDFLPGATVAGVRVGVSAYSMTGPVFYVSPSGVL